MQLKLAQNVLARHLIKDFAVSDADFGRVLLIFKNEISSFVHKRDQWSNVVFYQICICPHISFMFVMINTRHSRSVQFSKSLRYHWNCYGFKVNFFVILFIGKKLLEFALQSDRLSKLCSQKYYFRFQMVNRKESRTLLSHRNPFVDGEANLLFGQLSIHQLHFSPIVTSQCWIIYTWTKINFENCFVWNTWLLKVPFLFQRKL